LSRVSDPVELSEVDGKYTARLRFRTAANEDRTCCAEWTGAEPKLIIYKDGTRREVVVSMQEEGWNAPAYEQFRFQGKTEDTACQLRLLRLPDAGNDEFKLLGSSIMPSGESTYPEDIGPESVAELGPYYPRGG